MGRNTGDIRTSPGGSRTPPGKLTETEFGRVPIVGLLNEAGALMDDRLFGELRASGYPELRPGHACVFGHIRRDGSRLTDLAESAKMTKQAVGEAVSELERIGYLERVPDPTDGRAKILKLTRRGQNAQDKGYEIIRGIERNLADRYGVAFVNTLREALEDYTGGAGSHGSARQSTDREAA